MVADISGQCVQVSITNTFSHVICTQVDVILAVDITDHHCRQQL